MKAEKSVNFWPFRRIEYHEMCQSWLIENGAEGAKLRARPIFLLYLHIWFPNYSDTSTEWPGFRESHSFWGEAARHIQESTSANFLLSSMFEIVLSNTTIIVMVCNYLLLLLVNE